MGMSEMVITVSGRALVAKLIDGATTCEFTKMATSSHLYESADALTALEDIKQTVAISSKTRVSSTEVKVSAAFSNEDVTEEYYIRALGLYAEDGDGNEILFGVSLDSSPSYMPDASSPAAYTFTTTVEVGNSSNVTIVVDPGAYALAADLTGVQTSVTELTARVAALEGDTHAETSVVGAEGVHDIRYYDDELQVKVGDEWEDVGGGSLTKSTLTVTTADENLYGASVTVAIAGETLTGTFDSAGSALTFKTKLVGTATVTAVKGEFTGEETVDMASYGVYSVELASGEQYTVNLTTTESTLYGKTITATYGAKSKTATFSATGTAVMKFYGYTGEVTFTATDGTDTATKKLTITAGITTYTQKLNFVQIYGVTWDGTSTTILSRTDEAAGFTDPSPAVGNGNGSSPFDDLLPWSGMKKVEDATAGTLVEIPKFWYKITKNGTRMSIQIADGEEDGFHVSPLHMDRGDGKGERDVAYVGRYHCATSTYKSTTGVKPQASQTRAAFRTAIAGLGSDIWQFDYAALVTIWLLYIVEYANWNSQAVIGYGCGNNSGTENAGLTDAMIYHTGTNAASRTTYGHTQYRYIEDLWGNVYDWCDGIYFNAANIYCIKDPSAFSDTTGGTLVGTRPTSSNYISEWGTPSVSGYEYAIYPSAVAGSESTYICDYCSYSASGVVLRVGGNYNQYQHHGLFYLYGNGQASYSDAGIGSRLLKLP